VHKLNFSNEAGGQEKDFAGPLQKYHLKKVSFLNSVVIKMMLNTIEIRFFQKIGFLEPLEI